MALGLVLHSVCLGLPMVQDTPVQQIEQLRQELQVIYDSGRTRTLEWRKHNLNQLGLMLQDNAEAFVEALKKDFSRPAYETLFAEVNALLEEIKSACKDVKQWMAVKKPSTALQFKLLSPTVYHEPVGVVLILGAWNFPINLVLQPLIGSLAAGCPTMLKPSELSAHTAALIGELAPKYLPDSVRVVLGAVEQTTKLLELQHDHIMYTGGGQVGRIVATAAAKHLTPTTLELGGKSPVVVFDDISADLAAKRIIWGKYLNAGQICIAPDYVLCTPEMQPKLIEGFRKALKQFQGSAPDLLTCDDYCQIINDRHFQRISKVLEGTKGNVVIGGGKNASTRRIEPTVVVDVTPEDSLMESEIFGPLLPVLTMRTVDEMINYINANDTPLAMYVFSSSNKNVEQVRSRTRSGAFVINDILLHASVPELGFGGAGPSGYGAYHGKHSFDIFTHKRSSIKTPTWAEAAVAVRYPPYTASKTSAAHKAAKGHFKPGSPPGDRTGLGLYSTLFAGFAAAAAFAYRAKL